MAYHVGSEVGRLRQVILHRPGDEMTRLTPTNKDDLLFDDVLWLHRAQAEHDEFAHTLSSRGAEVLYLTELLAETLAVPEARTHVLDAVLDPRSFGKATADMLHAWASGLSDADLAGVLVAGVTKAELLAATDEKPSLYLRTLAPSSFLLPPLPNHLFTRDTSCWIYDGVAINSMRKPARMSETVNVGAIYRWHPRFADAHFPTWADGAAEGAATLEGGDVLIIGNGAVLIGLSERTSAVGVERVAQRLFAAGAATSVIAVDMPHVRAQMHLDTVMTMLDPESFVRYAGFGPRDTLILRPGPRGGLKVSGHRASEFDRVLARALGLDAVRVLTPPQDALTAEREQWNDACNVLAVAPGVVVAYERNVATSEFLRGHGIEVLEVPGGELGRGRGGPRCMSCPVLRDPL
ncbi:MAG TPA: arginine deiminase [Propioniciclava tarda]|nr:arginine deiminase [Propioniciclava tarda]HQA31780.1 arginine deiminase [Propioniciclava tarda]